MLMNIDCSIVQSLKVSLTFDNNKTKEREISKGDLCYFKFNKNGTIREIEGKVVKIGLNNSTNANSWFIVVDGSLDFSGQMERFAPTNILDVDIIQKHDTKEYISTPNDSTRITDMRYVNGYLQVSVDGGYSYEVPKNLRVPAINDGDEFDDFVQSENSHGGCKPHKKPIYVEDTSEGGFASGDSIQDESY